MKYLIDTDWVVNHLRGVERVTERLEELADSGLALSIISLAELYEGIYRSTNPDKAEKSLNVFLTAVTVLGINGAICRVFGRERSFPIRSSMRRPRSSNRPAWHRTIPGPRLGSPGADPRFAGGSLCGPSNQHGL